MLTPGRMPLVGVFSGVDNEITGADDAFLRIIGYSRAEFDGSRREKRPLSPPESVELDLAALHAAASTGGFTAPYQKHFVHHDGHLVPVLVVFSLVGDSPGHWVGYAVDLSLPSGPLVAPIPPDTRDEPQPRDFYERLVGELLRERTRIVSMLDSTSALVWSVDPDLRVIGANPAFLDSARRRVGRRLQAGDPVLEPFDTEVRDTWEAWYRRALRGEHVDVTFAFDEDAIGDFKLSPIRDANGTILGVAAVGTDVTAQHHAMAALAHRESMLRIAGRLGRIAGWTADAATRAVTVSEQLAELLDLGVVGDLPFSDVVRVFPSAPEGVWAHAERCLDDGTPFDLEVPMVTPGGRHLWLRVMGEPARDADGRIVAVHGAIADMTERRDTLAQLRQQSGLLENATDAILVLDLEGYVTYWNRAAENVYGWTAAQAVGRHISDLVDGGDHDRYRQVNSILWTDGEFSGRIENFDRSGRTVVVELHVNLIRDDAGQPTAVFSIASDVTERVELEERLALSQKLESVGQLTGGIAHDFNNLLTVILGTSELLAESVAHDDELSSLNQMVITAAERGAELTARLLAFARRQPLRPQVVDPAEVTENVLALLRRSLPESVEVDCSFDESHWPVRVDPGQFEAALMNVMLNARDAMDQDGRLTITITNAVVDDEPDLGIVAGDYVRISVADDGIGMSTDVRERAFDPFFTTKGPGRGSGLGLSMVYGFTRQSGGIVEMDSESGAGTTVDIWLPRADPSLERDDSEPRSIDGLPRGTERILVVEDEPMVRDQAITTLRGLGYDTVEATDAPAALALLEGRDDVDLVFTDVMMPGGMSGLDLVAAVRHRSPDQRVLLTTGYAEGISEPEHAAAPVLRKPYRRQALARAIRQALDEPPGQPTRR